MTRNPLPMIDASGVIVARQRLALASFGKSKIALVQTTTAMIMTFSMAPKLTWPRPSCHGLIKPEFHHVRAQSLPKL